MILLNAKILLVKDELNDVVAIEAMIEESGYETLPASAAEHKNSAQLPKNYPALIVCHYSKKENFSGVKMNGRHIPILLISDADEKMVISASSIQKIAYLTHPFSKIVLKTVIDMLLTSQ